VTPDAVIGHSVGEYVAACVAGVFSLEDGLRLVAARGRLMQGLAEGGAMYTVRAAERRVRSAITPYGATVVMAAGDAADQVVISGVESEVRRVADALEKEGVETKRLAVSRAFHSPLMSPVVEEFGEIAKSVRYSEPHIALFGNVEGAEAKGSIATGA